MKRVTILILLANIFIYAGDINIKIDTLISKIKQAKGDERRVLMNQLKLQLRELNQLQREQALKKLITNLNIHKQKGRVHFYINSSHNGSKINNHNKPRNHQPASNKPHISPPNHNKPNNIKPKTPHIKPQTPHTKPNHNNQPKSNHNRPKGPKHNQHKGRR